ncbi:MAG: transcriptional coactivator p15/PC4 family protein [Deltaproteobacteria bacterium]|nr:transcriptional coactivator p15/PC4 family protein [Deltaproteobacteria bacterium]
MADDKDKVVDSFKRNATEEVRGTVRTYRGKQYMDMRIYYLDDAGEYKPTKKGINLSVDLLGELTRMVEKLAKAVQEEQAAAPAPAPDAEAPKPPPPEAK